MKVYKRRSVRKGSSNTNAQLKALFKPWHFSVAPSPRESSKPQAPSSSPEPIPHEIYAVFQNLATCHAALLVNPPTNLLNVATSNEIVSTQALIEAAPWRMKKPTQLKIGIPCSGEFYFRVLPFRVLARAPLSYINSMLSLGYYHHYLYFCGYLY